MEKLMPISNAVEELTGIWDGMQDFNLKTSIETVYSPRLPVDFVLQNKDVCFYRVEMLSYDEDYPRREAFENVLSALENKAFNFVYMLEGTSAGIELYIGVVKNGTENTNNMSASNYGENIKNVFEGNFNGSILKKIKGNELSSLIGNVSEKYDTAGIIVGVPSVNDDESKDDFQGIDRLINSMIGLKWRIAVVCEPVSRGSIRKIQEEIYNIYNYLSVCSKMNMQQQKSEGGNYSYTKNEGSSSSTSHTKNEGTTTQKGISNSGNRKSTNSSRSENRGTSDSNQIGTSQGESYSTGRNTGSSVSYSYEFVNKRAQEIMSYIDDELLERMKTGFSKGLFRTSIYYMAETPVHASRLKNSIMALFRGSGSSYSPMVSNEISRDVIRNTNILSSYQNYYGDSYSFSDSIPILHGRPLYNGKLGLNTYLTAGEISLIAGLPQKEVPGLVLQEGINFGLNQKNIEETDAIRLGAMVQKGRVLNDIPFYLSRSSLSKHTFIAGVTGSGKTTTCHKLLKESNIPFLVIEPAKTEYRTLIQQYDDLVVFTIGNETAAPFRLNPFELVEGEIISAHIDMIKATFTSAFPMEASMPQLLEEAIIKCYEDKGWNVSAKCENPSGHIFPILSDLLDVMNDVVKEKNFGERMQGEYIGSLVSRLSNLTKGVKGNMLNCRRSVNFDYIAEHNVIFEMEELKSPEDKALFMGFILTRLSAVIKQKHKCNNDYRHITLIEEAHRLLSKTDYSDSGSKKAAVETFSDLLAEIRKYGEGLIIVDQIPNKLATEVIKNTNTKIIHKILAKDDKETVGDAMLMDNKQKEYLAALPAGETIIFTENTDKPVNVKIERISDTSEEEILDKIVTERFEQIKNKLGGSYENLEILGRYNDFYNVICGVADLKVDKEIRRKFLNKVAEISKCYDIDFSEVWEKFIDNSIGYISGRHFDKKSADECKDVLVDFFINIYSLEDFDGYVPTNIGIECKYLKTFRRK